MTENVSAEISLKRISLSDTTKSHHERLESPTEQKDNNPSKFQQQRAILGEKQKIELDVSANENRIGDFPETLLHQAKEIQATDFNETNLANTLNQQRYFDECLETDDIMHRQHGQCSTFEPKCDNRSLIYDCQESSVNLTASNQISMLSMIADPEETNFSQFDSVWLVKSWQEILLRVIFVAPIVLLGVIGNLTIIYSMCKFKRFRTKPTNIFILNMAFADLLTVIVCPNTALFMDIYQFYVMGAFICRFEGFTKITCFLVSAYSLIVLSFDWFLCVVQPCRKRISIEQSWITLAFIWFASILMASPLFVWRKLRERQWKDVLEAWCSENLYYTKYYWLCMTFFLIYLPTFIMTIVLVVILLQMDKFEAKLRRSRNLPDSLKRNHQANGRSAAISLDSASWNNHHNPSTTMAESRFTIERPPNIDNQMTTTSFASEIIVQSEQQVPVELYLAGSSNAQQIHSTTTTTTMSTGESTTANNKCIYLNGSLSISMKYRRRIVKILFAYLSCSIICWTPLQITIIYRHFLRVSVMASWFNELAFYTVICASLSGAMNPIIFGFLSQPFRQIVTKSWLFRLFGKLLPENRSKVDAAHHNHQHQHHHYHRSHKTNGRLRNHHHQQQHQQPASYQRTYNRNQHQVRKVISQTQHADNNGGGHLFRSMRSRLNTYDNDIDNNSALRLTLDFIEPNQLLRQATTPTELDHSASNGSNINRWRPVQQPISSISQFVQQTTGSETGHGNRASLNVEQQTSAQESYGNKKMDTNAQDCRVTRKQGSQGTRMSSRKVNRNALVGRSASSVSRFGQNKSDADKNNNHHKRVSFNTSSECLRLVEQQDQDNHMQLESLKNSGTDNQAYLSDNH